MMIRRLRRDAKAATTVEFALVGWMMCLVTFAIIETGVMWWLKSGMQITASMAARCGAVGYGYAAGNATCTDAASTQNYAVNTIASFWVLPNMITAANVTVTGRVSNSTYCNSAPGNFFRVSVSSNFFAFLPPPLGNYASLVTNACYPMP